MACRPTFLTHANFEIENYEHLGGRAIIDLVATRGEVNWSNHVAETSRQQQPKREKCLTVFKVPKDDAVFKRAPNNVAESCIARQHVLTFDNFSRVDVNQRFLQYDMSVHTSRPQCRFNRVCVGIKCNVR